MDLPTHPAPCRTLAPLRADVERARDARAAHPGDPAAAARMSHTVRVLLDAEHHHRQATGCTDHH